MKILKGIINVLTTLIIVVGVVFIGLYIFGITPYVVLSGSMETAIETGSLCFVNKNVKYEDIKKNDVVAYRTDKGVLVTHRVVRIDENGFVTKGDSNPSQDGYLKKESYIGKNVFSIPKVGYAVVKLQTTRGKIIFGTFW